MYNTTLATAYVATYNAPRFRAELRDNTVRRFNIVVYTAYTIAAVVFVIVAAIGFATFGSHAQPLILNNCSPSDPLAAISKTLLAASIVLTYPLPFVGLRDILQQCNRGIYLLEAVSAQLSAGIGLSVFQASSRDCNTRWAAPTAPSMTPGDKRSVSEPANSSRPSHSGVERAPTG